MGNALVDVLARVENDDIFKSMGLLKGAMTLIDKEKFYLISRQFKDLNTAIVSGGSASNTIIGLASLGVDVGFIGRVGNDFYGDIFKKDLEKYNVSPHLIYADEVSGVASTFISADGERTFGTFLGAAAALRAEDLSIDAFRGYDLFYIEGYLVQSHALIKRAVELAKEAGLLVALDLASYNIVQENKEFLLSIIPQYVDIVFANEEEARAMKQLNPEEAVSRLAKITGLAIVKAGKKGSWIQRGEYKIHVPGDDSIRCHDATGAGDLYAAGFIYGLVKQKEVKECAKIATLLAEEVIQNIGPKILTDRWGYLKQEIMRL